MKKLALVLLMAIMLSMIVSCTNPKESDTNSNRTSTDEEISDNSDGFSNETLIEDLRNEIERLEREADDSYLKRFSNGI